MSKPKSKSCTLEIQVRTETACLVGGLCAEPMSLRCRLLDSLASLLTPARKAAEHAAEFFDLLLGLLQPIEVPEEGQGGRQVYGIVGRGSI